MRYIFLIISLFIFINAKTQRSYKAHVIMFYNVENLFDTIKSADIIDGRLSPDNPKYSVSVSEDSAMKTLLKVYKGELTYSKLKNKHVIRTQILNDEFTPKGDTHWTSNDYNHKIENISKVILDVGQSSVKVAPALIGLAEIENEHVLKDLCENLNKRSNADYDFIHYNSFDARGIDVALLYNKKIFEPISKKRYFVDIINEKGYREYTRDILLVKGLLDGEELYFTVNHWPSKRGGEKISTPKRESAANKLKSIIDSILITNPDAKIITMGDFNDDANSSLIKKHLNTVLTKDKIKKGVLYNPSEYAFKNAASTAYRDAYSFIDQFMLTPSLINSTEGYKFLKMNVFSPDYLKTKEGPYKGYPFRSFTSGSYTGGYSDHFPVYMILVK